MAAYLIPSLVALAGALFLEFIGVVIWGATVTQRVTQLEKDIAPLSTLSTDIAVLKKTVGRLERVADKLEGLG